ncbi:MAG: patatin-like phospholipase family protein [Pseudomonadales bacterium]
MSETASAFVEPVSMEACNIPAQAALVLSGGGARAAYQVGVMKAIAKILPPACANPFPIICGTSAGAINAAMLATQADHFAQGIAKLENIWGSLHAEKVVHAGYGELLGSSLKLLLSFFRSGVTFGRPLSLFDNMPLYHLLLENIDFQFLPELIERGYLRALCITAMGYHSGQSISFFQGHEQIENWHRIHRIGLREDITHKHLMASSALPALFPAVHIHREFFGDGAMRQSSPMSAALHLGAEKILVIGVSGRRNLGHLAINRNNKVFSPSIAQIFAQMLNSAFVDAMEEDINMMHRFNKFVSNISDEKRKSLNVREVDTLVISPSIHFDEIAAKHIGSLPKSLQLFLRTIGATRPSGGASIASYLLFEASYCEELMQHGYEDCMAQAEKVKSFLS